MADSLLENLSELTSPTLNTDLMYLVEEPESAPVDKNIIIANLLVDAADKGDNTTITELTNLDDHSISIDQFITSMGVTWDVATDTFYRTGLKRFLDCSSGFPSNTPIYKDIKRCVIDSDGDIIHYLDPENSYYAEGTGSSSSGASKADSTLYTLETVTADFGYNPEAYIGYPVQNTTTGYYAIILSKISNYALGISGGLFGEQVHGYVICTGAIGGVSNYSVMVEIPKFYYRCDYNNGLYSWEISEYPQSGFSIHPAFIKNGSEVDNRYVGAYEGTGWDNSYGGFINHDHTTTGWYYTSPAIDTANDKLCSISNWDPITNEYRSSFRAIASNRGTGWRQFDYDLLSAIQLLYIVEYADWNSQDMIGEGNITSIKRTGLSNLMGNGSGEGSNFSSYRGIENLYGNVWKWVDGVNLNYNEFYVSNNDTYFADNTTTNYTPLSITAPMATDYIKAFHANTYGFVPSVVGGSSSTYVTDKQYSSSIGWSTLGVGGRAGSAEAAGMFAYAFHLDKDTRVDNVGGRLCY